MHEEYKRCLLSDINNKDFHKEAEATHQESVLKSSSKKTPGLLNSPS